MQLKWINSILTGTLIGLVKLYQRFISPVLPKTCRFYPTCSKYTKQAILKYGPWKGLYLSGKRIIKCHPWNEGGIDRLE